MADESVTNLPEGVGRAVSAASLHGLALEAIGVYARWWQLERWIRTIVYVELRAAFGARVDDAARVSGTACSR